MNGPASPEINKLKTPEQAGPLVNKITSPGEIHHETAVSIVDSLKKEGHGTTVEEVKNDQEFKPTPDLIKQGIEPSGEMSAGDVLRWVTEDLEGGKDSGTHRIVTGKGKDAIGVKRGKEQRPNKVVSIWERLGFKKAKAA